MKKIVLLFGLSLFTLNIQAQVGIEKSNATDSATTELVYDIQNVDKQPKFPGGITSLQSYINRSLKYPQISRENNSQGRVIVRFARLETEKAICALSDYRKNNFLIAVKSCLVGVHK